MKPTNVRTFLSKLNNWPGFLSIFTKINISYHINRDSFLNTIMSTKIKHYFVKNSKLHILEERSTFYFSYLKKKDFLAKKLGGKRGIFQK